MFGEKTVDHITYSSGPPPRFTGLGRAVAELITTTNGASGKTLADTCKDNRMVNAPTTQAAPLDSALDLGCAVAGRHCR